MIVQAGHIRPTPGHRPAVERRPCLGVAQSLVEAPGSGVVVLNQDPGRRPTMIDDLQLQRP